MRGSLPLQPFSNQRLALSVLVGVLQQFGFDLVPDNVFGFKCTDELAVVEFVDENGGDALAEVGKIFLLDIVRGDDAKRELATWDEIVALESQREQLAILLDKVGTPGGGQEIIASAGDGEGAGDKTLVNNGVDSGTLMFDNG